MTSTTSHSGLSFALRTALPGPPRPIVLLPLGIELPPDVSARDLLQVRQGRDGIVLRDRTGTALAERSCDAGRWTSVAGWRIRFEETFGPEALGWDFLSFEIAEPEETGKRILPLQVSEGERLEIGRDPRVEIALDDGTISRRHAEISVRGGELHIRDLGSRHHTLVNGQRILGTRRLRHGDLLRLGDTLIRVVDHRKPRGSAAAPESAARRLGRKLGRALQRALSIARSGTPRRVRTP